MNKTRIAITLAVVAGFSAWLLIPPLTHYVAQEFLFEAQRRGLKLRVDGLEGRRIGITAEGVEGWVSIPIARGAVRELPVSLHVEQTQVFASAPLLRPWAIGARFAADLYGGTVRGFVSGILTVPALSATLQGVDLTLHPQLSALGVQSGTVDVELSDHPITSHIPREASYSLEVKNLNVMLPPMIAQLAKLETLSDLQIRARGVLKTTGRFNIPESTIRGSFGEASMIAQGLLEEQALRQISGTLLVNLNGVDGEKLRPWAALFLKSTNSDLESIRCVFKSGSCSAQVPIQLDLGRMCVLASCS